MARNTFLSEIDATKAQLGFLFVVILLSVDSINPIKIFLHVFPQVLPWHIALTCILVMMYIILSELKYLLYFSVQVFFHSILEIFFRDVEVIGHRNIPTYGPVIFTGNHCNQFIDGVLMMCTCKRKVSYLVAEKSWNRPVIGDLSWAMGAVPIKRSQDSACKGSGKMMIEKDEQGSVKVMKVNGVSSQFIKEIKVGDKVRLPDNLTMKITKIESDILMFAESIESEFESNKLSEFEILKRVDQSNVYERVLDRLAAGGSIGIFPEGGSHDRTDLLPLKPGVALIAYYALEKHGINVPIVPVGLNYFQGHLFRGRAIVEYGQPTYIDPDTLGSFKAGGAQRRTVCNKLLEKILDSMRSVLVTTPDFQTLQIVYAARRLYQREEHIGDSANKQDLTRRFAHGYQQLMTSVQGNPPPEWLDIQERIIEYQQELSYFGLKDYQVPALAVERDIQDDFDNDTVLREVRVPLTILRTLFLFLLALLPAICLNLPVGFIAQIYSEQRRKYALSHSKVKIYAYDVMLSEKVLLCIWLLPTLWFIYTVILITRTDLEGPTIAFCASMMPFFAYLGIMATEAGMINYKRDLRPLLIKLLPSARKRLRQLPQTRRKLQTDLREFIKKIGPKHFSDIYYKKDLNWKEIEEKGRKEYEKHD